MGVKSNRQNSGGKKFLEKTGMKFFGGENRSQSKVKENGGIVEDGGSGLLYLTKTRIL